MISTGSAPTDTTDVVLYQLFGYAWINVVIYLQSRLDLKDLQKTITLISYKTSNDQRVCESLEYWKFNNLAIALNEILEEEAKAQSSEGKGASSDAANAAPDSSSMMSDAKRSMSSMMGSMRSSGKLPSMPKLK